MKRGWYYREGDRMILHRQNPEDVPLSIGQVPKITAQIVHLTDDGEDIRSEYLAVGKRQRRARILTEDELDRGTWAAKMGMRRPTGNDERHAFARKIREEGDKAPVTSARTYYSEDGELVFPAADAQTLGYRVLRGEEEAAREAWEEIGAWMTMDGKSALVAGGYFAGPVLDTLDMLAHMISVHGPGQQGKSTILVVCASCYGDIKPRRQSLWMTWNASKQGITQSLRQRGYLPVALDEHSSSGRTIKESSREISQMVAGAIRAMGTADGSPRESDGFWHSVILSSSNEPLKHEGQTEDLASRLQEFKAPFFPNKMVDAEGAPAEPGHRGAEHISKRLKRLAKDHGGWPLEWAVQLGMYKPENLARIRALHLELCAKYRPAQGGIAATIAELHMAWVVGAHMLGNAIGIPSLGAVAEAEAAARLAEAIEISAEANVPDSERLWNALDSLRIEASAFPDIERLPTVAEEGFRKLRGFTDHAKSEWWVIDPVVRDAAAQAGIDNFTAALRQLADLGVHLRPKRMDGTYTKDAKRKLPQSIRHAGLGERMHCFSTRKAAEIFASDDEPEDGPGSGSRSEFPCGATPGATPGATGVAPENRPLNCGGATGATGATLSLFDFSKESGATPSGGPMATGSHGAVASWAHDVTSLPPMPTQAPAVVFPAARMYETGDKRLDTPWLLLEAKAKGRTLSALNFGVLGNGVLHLPNHEPIPVPLPASADEVPALMTAYGLKTLWVHQEALEPMGLPATAEERIAQYMAALPEDERKHRPGAQSPLPHAWTTPGAGSPITGGIAPQGLATWMTLKVGAGAAVSRLTVSIPAYDTRLDKTAASGRGGFGGAPTPAVMLDALMVYLLSTLHGPAEAPKVIPYYLSPNKTGEDFAGGRDRDDVLCEAVRDKAVPPAIGNTVPVMVPQQWHREPTAQEREAGYLHRYDKNAAWLGAFKVKVGIGEPVHGGEGTTYDKAFAGYWRVAEVPGRGLPGLPELAFRECEEGGFWVTTPNMELLLEIYPQWEPRVLESWHWPVSKSALEGMYERLRVSRNRIVVASRNGHPGAKWAKQINGKIYQSFRGYLGRIAGPQTDHATGQDYRQDIYYRPDWAHMILCLATANVYRNLKKFAQEGHLPLSAYVDAVTYPSNVADPMAAKPSTMTIGDSGGQWSLEGSAPMAELLPSITPTETIHNVLSTYLSSKGE
ncbi:DUF927 domain-containing protein [Streptomyces fimicarius]|uniref:DUF927 domain-containing protein n=1 Tax=Streptomyces griseus TaxID=1911 RepID=UPI0036E734FB